MFIHMSQAMIILLFVLMMEKNYLSNYEITGINAVEERKKLAIDGQKLNSYIKKNVDKKYVRKWSQ